MKEFLKYLFIICVGIGIGLLINIPTCNRVDPIIKYIPIHDTITIDSIRIIEHTKIKQITDTLLQVDSVILKGDTIYVELPIEYKQYKDTIQKDSSNTIIAIDYHGIYSNIDSIYLQHNYYNKQEIIYIKPKKIGLDLTIGPSIGWDWGRDLPKSGAPVVGINLTLGLGLRLTK